MSDEQQTMCNNCNHEEKRHDILKEPYGHLCVGCFDDGNSDPCRSFSQWLRAIFLIGNAGIRINIEMNMLKFIEKLEYYWIIEILDWFY